MELRIYKSHFSHIKEARAFLEEDGRYEKVDEIAREREYDTHFELYIESKDKNLPDWIKEIKEIFDFKLEDYTPRQFNGIILAETQENLYLVPKGYAYHIVEKMSDLNFGMEIAERKIPRRRLNLKSSHFLLQNKMSEIAQYKGNLSDSPIASESIVFISGKTEGADEAIFGKTMDCSYSIALGKKFNLDSKDPDNNLEDFFDIFNQIDQALISKKISRYPRINYIERDSKIEQELDAQLLDLLLDNNQSEKIFFDLNRINLVGSRINIVSMDDEVSLYVKNRPSTEQNIEINDESISEYAIKYKDKINKLDDIKCKIINKNEPELYQNQSLKRVIFAEIEYDDKVYLLSNGRWGYLTQSFFNYLDDKLEKLNDKVQFLNEFNAPNNLKNEKGKLNEDKYVDYLAGMEENIQLHKRFVVVDGVDVEIADIFNKESKELYAIKIGTNTANSLYSFDQSVLAINMLIHHEDFEVKKHLEKYIDGNLTAEIIDDIVTSRSMNVLWVADGSVNYVYNGVADGKFKLTNFKSFLLKLKIVDWFDYADNNGFNPRIYFSKFELE